MINYNDLKIFIQRRWDSFATEVWVFETRNNEDLNIYYDGENLVKTQIKHGEFPDGKIIKPFLILPVPFANALFKAIAEYNTKEGVKTKDENLIEGKLIATEEHLKDMREFSKKLLNATLGLENKEG